MKKDLPEDEGQRLVEYQKGDFKKWKNAPGSTKQITLLLLLSAS